MKTEVYSYRLTSARKASLERAARRRKLKIAHVLDMAVDDWLAGQADETADDEEQKRLHRKAERYIGVFSSGDPTRSSRVREIVRERLAKKYGR